MSESGTQQSSAPAAIHAQRVTSEAIEYVDTQYGIDLRESLADTEHPEPARRLRGQAAWVAATIASHLLACRSDERTALGRARSRLSDGVGRVETAAAGEQVRRAAEAQAQAIAYQNALDEILALLAP